MTDHSDLPDVDTGGGLATTPEADDILRDQNGKQDRRRTNRIPHPNGHDGGAECAEPGEPTLGESDQDDGGNGE